jgi:hypothetical protein
MSTILRRATTASALVLMAFATAGIASAQDTSISRKTFMECADQGTCRDESFGKSRKAGSQYDQDDYNQIVNQHGDKPIRKKRTAQKHQNGKLDYNRHDRRRSKDAKFRFYLDGFYYAQPYWTGGSYGIQAYRVSCGEGRRIVDDSGYSRVRTIECGGGTFTYMGRRNGDTFKIFLNSRTGRIVGRQEL